MQEGLEQEDDQAQYPVDKARKEGAPRIGGQQGEKP
jgi:hypothetical protein